MNKECLMEDMVRVMGAVGGGNGCGVAFYWRGRRRVGGSVLCYFITLCCRKMSMMLGGGY